MDKIATETNFRSFKEDILTELRDKYPDKGEIEINAMADNRIRFAAKDGKFDCKLSDIEVREVGEESPNLDRQALTSGIGERVERNDYAL